MTATLELCINGVIRQLHVTTLSALIDNLELTGKRIAVEVNGNLVAKSQHATYLLNNQDRIEIVHAVGGG